MIVRYKKWWASALFAASLIAWVSVLALVIGGALNDDETPAPDDAPVRIGDVSPRATLSVLSPTAPASPTPVTPTLTPTRTPSLTPSPTTSQPPSPLAAATTPAPTQAAVTAEPTASAPTPTPGSAESTPAPAQQDPAAAAPDSDLVVAPAAQAIQGCVPPEGWEGYNVQPGDTLFAFVLGAGNTVTVDELMAANCLDRRWLKEDELLYLPPGAAENAPPSDPVPASGGGGVGPTGPRTPDCPCTITVAAGWRREQIAEAVNASSTMFTGADFLAVTGPGASAPFDFVMERPGGTSMEGYLFPGSYTAQNDTTAEGFRDMLLSAFGANVSPQVRADAAAQGVSFYQALIIASIVQRETRAPETQKLVASVYYNRVRAGSRLGTTVSVQYALGASGNWWPRVTGSGLEVDSPYNTYNRPGLPPTPIDSPGLTAILGTVYAPQTNYYYHTASCNGTGEAFAETYEQHLANVNCDP